MSESTAPVFAYSYAPDRIAPYCLYPDNRYLRRMIAGNVLNYLLRSAWNDPLDRMGIPRDLPGWKVGIEIVIHSMQHPFPLEDFEAYPDDMVTAQNASNEMMRESMQFWIEQIKPVRTYRLAAQFLPAIVDVAKSIQADALLWFLHQEGLINQDAPALDHLDTLISTVVRMHLSADEAAQAISDAGMMATWFLAVQLELCASLLDQPPAILSHVLEAAKVEVRNGDQLSSE